MEFAKYVGQRPMALGLAPFEYAIECGTISSEWLAPLVVGSAGFTRLLVGRGVNPFEANYLWSQPPVEPTTWKYRTSKTPLFGPRIGRLLERRPQSCLKTGLVRETRDIFQVGFEQSLDLHPGFGRLSESRPISNK